MAKIAPRATAEKLRVTPWELAVIDRVRAQGSRGMWVRAALFRVMDLHVNAPEALQLLASYDTSKILQPKGGGGTRRSEAIGFRIRKEEKALMLRLAGHQLALEVWKRVWVLRLAAALIDGHLELDPYRAELIQKFDLRGDKQGRREIVKTDEVDEDDGAEGEDVDDVDEASEVENDVTA